MPFQENTQMDERYKFVSAYRSGAYTMSELCEHYDVSRPTGYKWVERYAREGVLGLQDRSSAAHDCPHRMSPQMQSLLLAQRHAHPHWGARKILNLLARKDRRLSLPSRSAASALFKRAGLVQTPRRRPRASPAGAQRARADTPNAVWTIDFKGQFRTRDHRWCYPLTIMDLASRYPLTCQGKPDVSSRPVSRTMRTLFEAHGLPECIHSDNGSPFASVGLCGLSRLSLLWLKLGIRVQRSRPAHPQDNGAHERMHRSLKAATTRTPAAHMRAQQRRFDGFRCEYNQERSHEALADRTPADLYQSSVRTYPAHIEPPHYPGHFEVRRVSAVGAIKWGGRKLFIGEAFQHELLGFEEVDEGIWSMYFAAQLLARFDQRIDQFFAVPL